MRDEKITIAKAIAIILMVVAHAGIPHVGGAFISMFHMPLFFFVSGYCFKDKYLANPKRFAVNKVKGLYVPFVKWSLISFFRVGSLTFFSGFFIVMGRAYKRINVDADKWWVTFAAFMVVAVGSVWCSASMLKYTAAQILPYSACAILGTIMVLNLSHLISLHQNVTKRVLMFVGDHTLEVLTWPYVQVSFSPHYMDS